MSSEFLIEKRNGFGPGLTWVTEIGERSQDTGIAFGVLKLGTGETHTTTGRREAACLLLQGRVRVRLGQEERTAERGSFFDESPFAAHAPAGSKVLITAEAASELILCEVENPRAFAPASFDGKTMVETEHRNRGVWENTAYRIVRTIFDTRNRPESNMVLGEVMTMPGHWSSYPPHHHPHPEIYHYRFTAPSGYGHAELGNQVLRVKSYDTVKILDEADHPQVAAPGYGMFYVWVIRHLPGNPYKTPSFTAEHQWLSDPGATVWRPRPIPV